jgi:predicted RNA-binding Zn ribbon-like protein
MTGENDAQRPLTAAQPGGRPPAPAQLALVQSFINTFYDLELEHGSDLFATPRSLATWLAGHGLLDRGQPALDSHDVRRAISLREGLRSLAQANNDSEPPPEDALARLNEVAGGAAVEVRFSCSGPRFVASGRRSLAGALGVVLADTAAAMIDGSWTRLKICPGEDCGWAFYDHSRNQTGRWCSMRVCGGRAKARAYYRRRRGGER